MAGKPLLRVTRSSDSAGYLITAVTGAAKTRLTSIDTQMRQWWKKSNPYSPLAEIQRIDGTLANSGELDPWIRTLLLARKAADLSLLGRLDRAAVEALLKEPVISAEPFYYPAFFVARYDRDQAMFLFSHAMRLDSRIELSPVQKKLLGFPPDFQ
jgi:hypothetical protein